MEYIFLVGGILIMLPSDYFIAPPSFWRKILISERQIKEQASFLRVNEGVKFRVYRANFEKHQKFGRECPTFSRQEHNKRTKREQLALWDLRRP